MNTDELFKTLDLEGDGFLSRSELHRAARELGWHWQEAPFYAVLDRLTLEAPLSRQDFSDCLRLMQHDPRGPYGQVLNRIPALEPSEFSAEHTALLIIDPQQSFTRGAWKESIGSQGAHEVAPIQQAFQNCAEMLARCHGSFEILFTRCPFPPDSYDWDDGVAAVLPPDQPYFIKPGNSVLWPENNGYSAWLRSLLDRGKKTLVMGGCTLNSCVRVSAIETQQRFVGDGLEVVVDLGLSGARASNYQRSPLFNDRSSVEAALQEMRASGVRIVDRAF